MSMFTKATKKKAKLRAALFGPSGSGKTYSALRMATGIGGKIAVIDTEHGSASKYSDRFAFDVCDLKDDQSVHAYVATMAEAGKAGYDVLVIDSLTHGWQELLSEVEQIAKAKYKGNTWSAWSEGNPVQKSLIKAILSYPGHVIATMRSKTEWNSTTDERSKVRPIRIGLAPEQGKSIEFEFDLLLEFNTEHMATVIKDRTGKFQDKIIEKPGEDFGKALADWLNEGELPPPPPTAMKSLLEQKKIFLSIIQSKQSDKSVARKIAGLIVKDTLDKEKIDTQEEMDKVTSAMKNFDLNTGLKYPEQQEIL